MNWVNILFEEVDIIHTICEGNLSNFKDIIPKLRMLYEDLLFLENTHIEIVQHVS